MDKSTLKEKNGIPCTNNMINDEKAYNKFFEEFFNGLLFSKEADVISAREYLFKSIDAKETKCSTVKDFFKELLYNLYFDKEISNYYEKYLNWVSVEKVGWFKYEQFVVLECLVTVLEHSFVSQDVTYICDKLLKETFVLMNKSYE